MAEERYAEIGLPVAAEFAGRHGRGTDRTALRLALGLGADRFLVLVTGGAEGSGDIYRRTAAILRRAGDVDVAVICGRNVTLRRRLTRLAARSGGRLTVQGFVDNMADWLRCADVVVGKAGPGTIAEAACCGAALLLTSYLPGQEQGNADFVVSAGAGRYVPGLTDLVAEIDRLRQSPAALLEMRAASAAISRPGAAAEIAMLLASLADGGGRAGRTTETTLPAAWQPARDVPPLVQKPEVWTVLPQRATRASRRARRDLVEVDGGGRRAKTLPKRRKLGKL